MSADTRVLVEAGRLAELGRSFVLVTVAGTQGSSPRETGAKMIWLDGEDIVGTIGGGELERLAIEHACELFESRSGGVERFVLGADADQCCGGTVELLFEFFGPRHRLVIFGAGHVALELVRCLQAGPFEIAVVDDRPEWNNESRFGGCQRVMSFDDGVALAVESRASTMVCVMSCSHDRDFEVLRAMLGEPPAFVGLIGSKSKRACFFTRLAGAGIGQEAIQKVHCPIGLGDMGKAPGLVAVSIAGQLLLEAQKLEQL